MVVTSPQSESSNKTHAGFLWRSDRCSCINKIVPSTSWPSVSIGLPIYNGAAYLSAALEALLSQNYPNFHIVISDNCSTDSTDSICQEFLARDERVRYHRNERNLGAAANFNRVVDLAEGKYFAWASHDDLWEPNYISRCVDTLESCPQAVLAFSKSAKIDGDGAHLAGLMHGLGLDADEPEQRLREFHDLFIAVDRANGWGKHDIQGLWIPVFGLMRLKHLRETGVIGAYISSDTILIEELLMHGAFAEVEELLFFKRDHEDRSMRASKAYAKRIRWFTGQEAGVFIFPRWRLLAERLRAVKRTPLTRSARGACYREMIEFYFRRPHEGKALVKEVLVNGVRLARPLLRRFRVDEPGPEKW